METAVKPLPPREELKKSLKKIYQQRPNEVILFASRCALRLLPFPVMKLGESRSREHAERHIVATYRACLVAWLKGHNALDLNSSEVRSVGADAADAADAAADAAAYAAADAAYAAAYADAVYADAYAAAAADAAAAYAFAAVGAADWQHLESGNSLQSLPLWQEIKPKAQARVDAFFRYARGHGLGLIADDYQALIDGNVDHLIKAGWGRYEKLWQPLEAAFQADQNKEPSDKKASDKKAKTASADKASAKDETEPSQADNSKPETELEADTQAGRRATRYLPHHSYHLEDAGKDDHLNREPLAKALAQWLKHENNQGHLALGLFGDWGVGKTTFVNLLKKALPCRSENEASVKYLDGEFNAWSYEHCGNIQAGLAQEFVNACVGDSISSRFWLALRFMFKAHRKESVFFFGVIFLTLVLVSYDSDFARRFAGHFGISWGWPAGFLLLIALYTRGKKILAHPLAKDLRTYLRLPDFGAEMGKLPVMKEQIKMLAELTLGKRGKTERRLLFVVDDLDRCSPQAVVKTLEAVRIAMDLPHVVIIIAIDQKVALASLALHYEKLSSHHTADPISIARDYLGKVIHLPLTLERPGETDVTGFLQELWKTAEQGKAKPESPQPESTFTKPLSEETGTVDLRSKDKPLLQEQHNEIPDSSELTERKLIQQEVAVAPEGEKVQGLSEKQQALFLEWVHRLEISNPRRLKRLDNSYNLIRLRYSEEDQPDSGYPRLLMLLWLEYLGELDVKTRQLVTNALRSSEDTALSIPESLKEQFEGLCTAITQAEQDSSLLKQIYLQVFPYVLPAIETTDAEPAG